MIRVHLKIYLAIRTVNFNIGLLSETGCNILRINVGTKRNLYLNDSCVDICFQIIFVRCPSWLIFNEVAHSHWFPGGYDNLQNSLAKTMRQVVGKLFVCPIMDVSYIINKRETKKTY